MTDEPTPADGPITPGPKPSYRDVMRDVLAAASTALIAVAFLAPMLIKGAVVDADLKGAIILQWGLVMGYYFGSSKGSAAKDATIAQMTSQKAGAQ